MLSSSLRPASLHLWRGGCSFLRVREGLVTRLRGAPESILVAPAFLKSLQLEILSLPRCPVWGESCPEPYQKQLAVSYYTSYITQLDSCKKPAWEETSCPRLTVHPRHSKWPFTDVSPNCEQGRALQPCRNHSAFLAFPSFLFAQRLYRAAGEDASHQYTMTLGLPEFVRAKTNAANLSDVSLSCC